MKIFTSTIAAVGLAAASLVTATPAQAQSENAAIVITGEDCAIFLFRPFMPPLILTGGNSRYVGTNSGSVRYTCHVDVAPEQIPEETINVDQPCLGGRNGELVEGIGRVVITKGGRALTTCLINGSAKVIEF
ncbi:hypothetical protein [Altererythrobacter sp. MF3-039]|uniref:hypothetical protein n=1 Tax=Altererythrobacter sp. MF3-039 TaxID=3252901 RepID=UPI00390C8D35